MPDELLQKIIKKFRYKEDKVFIEYGCVRARQDKQYNYDFNRGYPKLYYLYSLVGM